MRVRIGKALLYGTGLTVGSGLGYSLYQSEGDLNNVGAVRFGRAALAVGKIGVDYKKTLKYRDVVDKEAYEKSLCDCHLRSAEELLKLCSVNGGVFIKVGQHIGALDYLLPEEYVNTMKVLHSRAPEMPLEDIYSVLKEELGKDVRYFFACSYQKFIYFFCIANSTFCQF